MKLIVLFCLAAFVASEPMPTDEWVTTVDGKPVEESGSLIFSDEFDEFDLKTWKHERTLSGGGNWEFQAYMNNRTNSFCEDGILKLVPTMTDERFGDGFVNNGVLSLWGGDPANQCTNPSYWGCERAGTPSNTINPIISTRLRTAETFSFKYGTVEAIARMPVGDWLWPAIWLLPRDWHYGGWPSSGEIDLVESRGNENLLHNGNQIGQKYAGSTLHYGPFYPINGYPQAQGEVVNEPGFGKGFHNYTVKWTPDFIQFFIDGEETVKIDPGAEGFWKFYPFEEQAPGVKSPWLANKGATKMAPFDKEFYLIINLAVGGTNGFFPDDAINGGPPKPWSNTGSTDAFGDFWRARAEWQPTWKPEEAFMEVDSIKVWAL